MFTRQSGIWPILCQLMVILAKCFEIWTSLLYCPLFTLTLIYKPILKSIEPKLAILSQKISNPHFAQVPFTKKPKLQKKLTQGIRQGEPSKGAVFYIRKPLKQSPRWNLTKQSILELNLKPPLYNLIIFTAIITKTIKFVASVFILYQNINK